MPTGSASPLGRAALAIADGKPVDWGLLSDSNPGLSKRLDALRRLQRLAEASRAHLERIGATPREETPGGASAGAVALPAFPFTWGPLRVDEKIGEGSFGEVYRAYDSVLQREVALKLTRASGHGVSGSVHLEEARRLARVRHPNVLTVHGVETHGGRSGMWTDYLRGETLEERIRNSDPPSAAAITATATDLCRALAAVHAAGIVHGDVKAANVMCEADGRHILMDFGAGSALPTEEEEPARPVTGTNKPRGAKAGTPLAMAPELLEGAPPTVQSDIYALGVLLYRLAARRYPLAARTMRQLRALHRKQTRVALAEIRPDLPRELARAIERALDPDAGARYRDATEMGHVLALASGFPVSAEPSPRSRPHNLPEAHDRFVGREREMVEVRRLVLDSPLVTLAGPGGAGKTRLALQAARDLLDGFPDGVFWVDLAPRATTAEVLPALAQALRVGDQRGKPLEEVVLEALSGRSALLVLDNCEHLLGECGRLVRLLRQRAPRTRLLLTSREALGLAEETTYAVGPLSLPPAPARGAAAPGFEIVEHDAVRLFVDRAQRSRHGFTLTSANAAAVASICRRLDGIPLAIELAATRAKVLSPEEIDARLGESLRVLGSAGEERWPHQKTLAASIEWSVRLLSEPERVLLRRLAVFAGRWTLSAAESVCRDEGAEEPAIGGESILDLTTGLAEKSLIAPETSAAETPEEAAAAAPARPLHGYRMLEMVRQDAADRLRRSGESDAVQLRLLRYAVAFAREAIEGLLGAGEAYWARRLDWEHENFLAVLRWVQDVPAYADEAMSVANTLRRYWNTRSLLSTGRAVFESLLSLPTLSAVQRGRGLSSYAQLLQAQGENARCRAACEEAIVLQRREGDELALSATLTIVSDFYNISGEHDQAVRLLEEAVELRRRSGSIPWIAGALCNLGVAHAYAGDLARAKSRYLEAHSLLEQIGDVRGAALLAGNLALTALDQDDLPEAKRWGLEALRRLRQVGGGLDTSGVLSTLARVALGEGDARTARERELESIQGSYARGDRRSVVRSLATIACACILEERDETAARLLGAVEAQEEGLGTILDPGFRKRLELLVGQARGRLGEPRYADLHALGRGLDLERALILAGAGDVVAGAEIRTR